MNPIVPKGIHCLEFRIILFNPFSHNNNYTYKQLMIVFHLFLQAILTRLRHCSREPVDEVNNPQPNDECIISPGNSSILANSTSDLHPGFSNVSTEVYICCVPKSFKDVGIQSTVQTKEVSAQASVRLCDMGIQANIDSLNDEMLIEASRKMKHDHAYAVPSSINHAAPRRLEGLTLTLADLQPPTSSPVLTTAPVTIPEPLSPIHSHRGKIPTHRCPLQHNLSHESFLSGAKYDLTFNPDECSGESSDDSVNSLGKGDLVNDDKYIIYESCLDQLFTICKLCRNPVAEVKKFKDGSSLKISVTCMNHCSYTWSSQPSASGLAVGNLLIAAAILFSGMTYQRFIQWSSLLNVATISQATFYAIQRTYLWPVIQEAWITHQESLLAGLAQTPLKLAGDGRCDSPGHNAKYGTYTMLDTESDKIVAFEIVQKSEVNNSACMEKEGLIRCFKKLQDHGVTVEQLATDRHPQIVCHMKKINTAHQFDIWHVSKSVVKKLAQKAKGKQCEDLRPWIRCIANHLWWCCATCKGDYDLLRDKWLSVLHHIANIHQWGHSEIFTRCEHEQLTTEDVKSTPWLKEGSPPHNALKEIVTAKKLLGDLRLMTNFAHTGSLEVYHSMLTKYCPKRQHFSYEGMQARTMLAMLDHNNNTGREQATTSSGTERFKYEWSKISKTWVVKPISVGKDYTYLVRLLERVVQVRQEKISLPPIRKPEGIPANIAPEPMPGKKLMLEQHTRRFQLE